MEADDEQSMVLSRRERILLQAGLKAYLVAFDAHRAVDSGASHSQSQWRELQEDIGRLLWRLEEAGTASQGHVEHSPEAVNPEE
jgi:hypothetical protein